MRNCFSRPKFVPIIFLCVSLFLSLLSTVSHAKTESDEISTIPGLVYSLKDSSHYEFSELKTSEIADRDSNTIGFLKLNADIKKKDVKGDFASYGINGSTASLTYIAENLSDKAPGSWNLVTDKGNRIDQYKTSSDIGKGSIIVLTSTDSKNWTKVESDLTNQFDADTYNKTVYEPKGIELTNGCYYKVLVSYKSEKKTGSKKVLFFNREKSEKKKTVELYSLYLYDVNQGKHDPEAISSNVGDLHKCNSDYTDPTSIGKKDPHFGWELGSFKLEGYTKKVDGKSDSPVFLKNVGDNVLLSFSLAYDIAKLNDDEHLSISDDNDIDINNSPNKNKPIGYGTLFIYKTDENGNTSEPIIYKDFLKANVSVGADTVVQLLEEGDYTIILDYELKSSPREVANVDILPKHSNYQISYSFLVRNGNCMVFPFDLKENKELKNKAITPNGFRLDLAKSKYLSINVTHSVIVDGPNGKSEDIRFNGPAKDGAEYTDEGIYTISVKNQYTGVSTKKTIYVGDSTYYKALSKSSTSVSDLISLTRSGARINNDGSLDFSHFNDVASSPTLSNSFVNLAFIVIVVLILIAVFLIVRRKRRQ